MAKMSGLIPISGFSRRELGGKRVVATRVKIQMSNSSGRRERKGPSSGLIIVTVA